MADDQTGKESEMFKKLWQDEEGATMVEYALMVALIAVACIVTVTTLGTKANGTFSTAEQAMP
jgi:pilus assembly protein Flp/PilA